MKVGNWVLGADTRGWGDRVGRNQTGGQDRSGPLRGLRTGAFGLDEVGHQFRDRLAELLDAEGLTEKIGAGLQEDFVEAGLAGIGADEKDGKVRSTFSDLAEAVGTVHAQEAKIEDDEAVIGVGAVEESEALFGGVTRDRSEAEIPEKALQDGAYARFVIDYQGGTFLRVAGHSRVVVCPISD